MSTRNMPNHSKSDGISMDETKRHSHRRHDHGPKYKQHSPTQDNGRSYSASEEHSITSSKKRGDSARESDKGEHFASDRKGDPGILQFGSNHSYEIPPYRRTGYGHVLGLARSLKIDRAASTVKGVRFISSDHSIRARNKHVFADVANAQIHTVWPSEAISDSELDKNYLLLDDREQGSDDSDLSEDSDSPDYRRASKKAKNVEEDLQTKQTTTRARDMHNLTDRSTWDHRVKSDPSDGQAWLELIKRQNVQSSGRQTRAELTSSAEIRLSMYEKALKHVTGPIREDLLRGLLKEAALVWDEEKLYKKWQDMSRKNEHSFGIQNDYINYRQTQGTRFRFDDLRTIYEEALNSVRSGETRQNREVISRSGSSRPEKDALYLLLRYTLSLKQAGYFEQAVAIWQAMLEKQFDLEGTQQPEDALEKFWDSEVPRIGEPYARGLSHFFKQGGDVPALREDTPRAGLDPNSIQTWLEDEEAVTKLLPARTGDITDDEDAFRVVLFADIQSFLLDGFNINQEMLLDAFLLFNGLPPLWQDETKSWGFDPFVYGNESEIEHKDSTTDSEASSDMYQSTFLGSSCRTTTDTLFSTRDSPLDCFSGAGSKITKRQSVLLWLRNVLRYLIDLDTNKYRFELLEYYLAFELKFFPQGVRKISKNYLKRHPQVLSLYNTHALIEYRLGAVESAKKVLKTAIKMRSGDSGVILLSRTLAWETLEVGEPSLALEYLLGNSEAQDEAAILERQRFFLSSMDKADEQHLVPSYMDCLLLLGYLSNPNPLSAALSIFQSNATFIVSKMKDSAKHLESLHQSLARLLYYHMLHHPYKPSTIRTAIQQSMVAFPANTVLISIFQLNEQRFRINDRVRSVAREILSQGETPSTGTSSPVITHAFAIQAEISRWTGLGSSSNSIRNAFERAVEDETTKNCASIWRWYAEYELAQGTSNNEKDQSRAQSIIFRAIAACPWVRDFYLMAIRCLSEAQDTAGCKGVYAMMVERELRVRRSLDGSV